MFYLPLFRFKICLPKLRLPTMLSPFKLIMRIGCIP